jgi:hypothetical protein
MALTQFQRSICRLIAQNRIASGESYVAGGAALNELLTAPRISRDVDVFHDTESAVQASWHSDRALLEQQGLSVRALRERPGFIEAEIRSSDEQLVLQWVRDAAFRFFPLIEHAEFGLTLHPFDLATNKVLALVGRLEVRDWIDVIECDRRLQPLGYLAWAACAKDPGFSPPSIVEHASRSARYSRVEIASLSFEGGTPDAAELSRRWHDLIGRARQIVEALPAEHAGECVLGVDHRLFTGSAEELREALSDGRLRFHAGTIHGSLPHIVV